MILWEDSIQQDLASNDLKITRTTEQERTAILNRIRERETIRALMARENRTRHRRKGLGNHAARD